MADSEDECAQCAVETMVETPQKKREYAEIVEEDVSIKPTSSKKQKAEKLGGKSTAKSKKWTDKEIDKLLEMLESRAFACGMYRPKSSCSLVSCIRLDTLTNNCPTTVQLCLSNNVGQCCIRLNRPL